MIAISGFGNTQFLNQSTKAPPPPPPRPTSISRPPPPPVAPKPISHLGSKPPVPRKPLIHDSIYLLLVETTQVIDTTTGAENSGIQANLIVAKCNSGASSWTESQVIPFQLPEANGSQLIQVRVIKMV